MRYTMPFLTQFWMFATPIVYPSSLLPEPWRTVYGLNPMVGVVEGFRWALSVVDRRRADDRGLGRGRGLAPGGGAFYFRRMDGDLRTWSEGRRA